jgi:hypothetical protein
MEPLTPPMSPGKSAQPNRSAQEAAQNQHGRGSRDPARATRELPLTELQYRY